MVFSYRPLNIDEIRLLNLEKLCNHQGQCDCLITCTVEHICLPSATKLRQKERYKGEEYSWPELLVPHDTDTLFPGRRDPCVDERKLSDRIDGRGIETEAALPWRYEWGDFIALSYAWRPAAPHQDILVNGARMAVTRNLYDALVQLRRCQRIRQGFKLWIDAICINQDDLIERGRQVTRMRDIYQSAWQVVIWAGPEADQSSVALTALHWLAHESKKEDPFAGFYREGKMIDASPFFMVWPSYESPIEKKVYRALFDFFSRAYWQRMWIIQEVAAGRSETPVLCGDKCISWGDLIRASQLISRDESRFGRDILNTNLAYTIPPWSFDFAKDRQPEQRQFSSERMWKIEMTMMEIQRNQHSTDPTSSWNELTQALTLVREASVTEERDRVYGILGIKAVADNLVWDSEPDYEISVDELWKSFTAGFLAAGNLTILRLVSRYAGPRNIGQKTVNDLHPRLKLPWLGPFVLWVMNSTTNSGNSPEVGTPCVHNIPSWTVCWSCAPAPAAPLTGPYHADAGLSQPIPVFPASNSSLTVKGVELDTIVSLSSSNEKEADTRYPWNSSSSQGNIYGDLEAVRTAFWKTIIGDTTSQGGIKAPEDYAWLLHPRLWQKGVAGIYTYGFGLHIFMARNRDLRLCGYTLEEIIFGQNKWISRVRLAIGDSFYDPSETQREAFSWAINAMAWRRLFGTRNGRMGLGTCAAEINDKIVVLRGCNTPLILREFNNGWKLIGECYTHGVMYGEVTAKDDELVDITIY
ncbi:hypothetical protein J7337_007999 [Fusarium musae]|uniref:Heterokaryon incompatibility domain-containing protein n=1 Tax=Fusarium musae TaxID=1042133 RepID=A0A9P8DCT6_9HYPO|nr:hypothetical protein J7337_007999 [Fusarium musae]KAG9499543.1 hypothetical protein J7337_007999 [Fusarium musae]